MNKQYDLMIDLEALSGNHTNPVILSIGAVAFDLRNIESVNELRERSFYVNVNGHSCENVGLQMDCRTFYWWLEQSREAQEAILKDRTPIRDALKLLANFYNKYNCGNVWANPASYDLTALCEAWKATDGHIPWKMNSMLDCRTAWRLLGSKKPVDIPGLVKHNALDDAIRQVINLQMALADSSINNAIRKTEIHYGEALTNLANNENLP
jgi:hypothetical protein